MISATRPVRGPSNPPGQGGPSSPPPPPRRQRPASGWLLALALAAACWLGGLAVNNLHGTSGRAAQAVDWLFPRFGGDRLDDASISAAWDDVRRHYVIRGVSGGEAATGAERGIIDMLRSKYDDRFSQYFTGDQFHSLEESLSGRRAGVVGIELEARCAGAALCPAGQAASVVAVTGVVHQSPAERAGVRNGDILQSVAGRALDRLAASPDGQIDRAGSLIRGQAGTSVQLGLSRHGESIAVTVTRADLSLPSALAQRFGNVLYLQVTGFNSNVARDSQKLLSDGLASGATGIVLDLRHNPGGLVSEAQDLASQFLAPSGTVRDVVVRRGRLDARSSPSSAQRTERDAVRGGGVATTVRLAVLVDQQSASAAEIVAAALKDYHRGVLVGARTFGKGSVQQDFGLPDGSDLHLTVEKWFGPNGESIDGTGVSPERAVALADEDHRFRLDTQGADPGADAQLQAALSAVQG